MANAASGIDPNEIVEDDLVLAHMLADVAAEIAVRHFQRSNLQSSRKADGSPVTEADWLIETSLRKQLERYRPDDAFVGEESGGQGKGARRWYVDPIDGTAGYLAGRPDWRTLIAVEDSATVETGLVSSPMLRRRWWATRGGGAWTAGSDLELTAQAIRLAVSRTLGLAQARVAIWPPVTDLPEALHEDAARLAASSLPPPAEPPTSTGTGHGALLVAAGLLDAFLFVGAGPWDLAAMVPIVEEAGGRFTDLAGGHALRTPAALFSNGSLHTQILACFTPNHWGASLLE